MTFFCTKCGWHGQNQDVPHLREVNRLCNYYPVPLPDLSPEDRAEVCRRFGIQDTSDSSKEAK